MSALELRTIFAEMPVGSFSVHVAERTIIEVQHSDFAMLSLNTSILAVRDLDGAYHWIDTFAITRIAHRPVARSIAQ